MAEAAAPALPQSAPRGGVLRFAPALLSALAFWWFLGFVHTVSEIGPIGYYAPWVPALGVSFSFMVDGLSLVFALLVTGIGALVLLYAAEYFRHHPGRNRLLLMLVLFEASMLGLVVADDILTLFLFWEGTTVTSFLLIGFDHEKADARAKALQALIVTGLGGVALLAGLLLLGAEVGSYRLSAIAQARDVIHASPLYGGIFVLIVLGCFTKSAQIPFHFWLPNAMAAPTPVSAYLHSATMVKAGVFLLARLSPGMGGTELWLWTLTGFGAATMLLSSIWSLRQTDLKLGLAFTTVMGLGTLTMFLGLGSEKAIVGFCVFLLVHAFYKACLFLVIGMIDKQAGTREVEGLGGLGRAMPLSFVIALLGAAAMSGFPPFLGFIGKEAMYEGALHGEALGLLALVAAVLANAMMICIAGSVALSPFTGERRSAKAEPRDPSIFLWFAPAVLALLGLLFGLAPKALDHALIAPMAHAVAGHHVETHLALWHGVGLPLVLSLLTFALGVLLFRRVAGVRAGMLWVEQNGAAGALAATGVPVVSGIARLLSKWRGARPIARFEAGYDAGLAAIEGAGQGAARHLQSGLMSRYLRVTFGLMAVMVLVAVALTGIPAMPAQSEPPPLFMLAVLLMAIASMILPFTESRLLQITALGVVGSGVALIFAIFSAIDVAITQLMVETLVVVIIAVALLKLPRIYIGRTARARRDRLLNAVVALALGASFSLALATATVGTLDQSITAYYEATSAPVALGRNIVNVILVDFRALDTMGEIAVIAVAGLAALALLAAGGLSRIAPFTDAKKTEPDQ